MTSAREPMRPPELPGYSFDRLLGSGGYSDVFLYSQVMPKRQVAVKVLLSESIGDAGRRQFDDEANTMAALSAHPYIVTIFHAAVAPGGNPYLVMEYYPRPNYSVRARTEQLSIADVLRTGVQVSSAIETAHRAGILHRDIKPANILTSEYGRPGLTDFGIAATTAEGESTEAAGMSIPWSPPEVVAGSGRSDERADVYSLAATVYTLLAGRSPFEVPGGSNRSLDLVSRIERGDLSPTGRGDVPASLERVLRRAMSKDPSARPASAAAFARSLQEVEIEQQLAMTMLDLRDDGSTDVRQRGGPEDEDGTRLKGPVVIRSQNPSGSPGVMDTSSSGTRTSSRGVTDGTVQRSAVSGDGLIAGVVSPSGFSVGAATPQFTDPQREGTVSGVDLPQDLQGFSPPVIRTEVAARNRVVLVSGAVLAIVVALVAVRVVMAPTDPSDTTDRPSPDGNGPVTTPLIEIDLPSPPSDLLVQENPDGSMAVSWSVPDAKNGDRYLVIGPDPQNVLLSEAVDSSVVLPAGSPPCFTVRVERGTTQSEPTGNCTGTGP